MAERLTIPHRAALVHEPSGRQRIHHVDIAPLEQVSERLHPVERPRRDGSGTMARFPEQERFAATCARTGTITVDGLLAAPPAEI